MKLIFPTWNEFHTPGYVGLLCYHLDNKQYLTCWFLQCCFFFVGRKLECTKIHDLSETAAEFYAAPQFWVHKNVCPPPHLHQPIPLINDRSLNTPHQCHYSSYLLISAFWGGVVKDREAPFGPNYIRLKNLWCLMLLLVVFYLQVLWNIILVVINVMQTGCTAPIVNRCQTFFKSVWLKISFIALPSFYVCCWI